MSRASKGRPIGKWLLLLPLLLGAVGLPLALEIVPPNSFYGIRTAKTLASEEAWYAANFWSGLAAMVLSIPATLLNFAIARSPSIAEDRKHHLPVLVLVVTAAGMIAAGLVAA